MEQSFTDFTSIDPLLFLTTTNLCSLYHNSSIIIEYTCWFQLHWRPCELQTWLSPCWFPQWLSFADSHIQQQSAIISSHQHNTAVKVVPIKILSYGAHLIVSSHKENWAFFFKVIMLEAHRTFGLMNSQQKIACYTMPQITKSIFLATIEWKGQFSSNYLSTSSKCKRKVIFDGNGKALMKMRIFGQLCKASNMNRVSMSRMYTTGKKF